MRAPSNLRLRCDPAGWVVQSVRPGPGGVVTDLVWCPSYSRADSCASLIASGSPAFEYDADADLPVARATTAQQDAEAAASPPDGTDWRRPVTPERARPVGPVYVYAKAR